MPPLYHDKLTFRWPSRSYFGALLDGRVFFEAFVPRLVHLWRRTEWEMVPEPCNLHYKQFEAFLRTGIPIEIPVIDLEGGEESHPRLIFHNGRHRTAVLHDRGMLYLPLAVREKDLPLWQYHCATREDHFAPPDDNLYIRPYRGGRRFGTLSGEERNSRGRE